MPRKNTEISEPLVIDTETASASDYTFEGLAPMEAINLFKQHNQGWKQDTPVNLPRELLPFVKLSDKFFSPLRQLAFVENRKMEDDEVKNL